jgi:peptidoglycan/LPS O-acetylase OafA/YrhL
LYFWQQMATGDYSLASPIWAFLMIIAVVALALLSYRYVERPLIRIGARLSANTAPGAANSNEKSAQSD